MSTAELRAHLHQLIDGITDTSILHVVYALLSKASTDRDWWNELSEEEKKSIERGLDDIKNGRVVPHETVMKTVQERIEAYKRKNG